MSLESINIDEIIEKLIYKNIINETLINESKTILYWIYFGRKFAESKSKKAVKFLEKNFFVSDNGEFLIQNLNLPDNFSTWFFLATLAAKNHIKIKKPYF